MLYLYSCVSFVGVAMLLLCTPVGFTRLFSVIGELIRRPDYLSQNEEEDLDSALLEEISLSERKKKEQLCDKQPSSLFHDDASSSKANTEVSFKSLSTTKPLSLKPFSFHHPDSPVFSRQNGHLRRPQSVSSFSSLLHTPSFLLFPSKSLKATTKRPASATAPYNFPISKYMLRRIDLEQKRKKVYIRRKFVYPLSMVSLLALMSITLLMVTCNITELIITGKVFCTESKEAMVLGGSSLSLFGVLGAFLEVIVILYLMLTSLIGVYSLPGFKRYFFQFFNNPYFFNCSLLLFIINHTSILAQTAATEGGHQDDHGDCQLCHDSHPVLCTACSFTHSRSHQL